MCLFCTGHRPPAAGVGDHAGVERQLGRLEGRSVCYAADGEHGEHGTGHVQETPQTPGRTQGQFHRADSGVLGVGGVITKCTAPLKYTPQLLSHIYITHIQDLNPLSVCRIRSGTS